MVNLLFSFQGRVNRAKWWLTLIATDIVGIILIAIVLSVLGGGVTVDPATGTPKMSGGGAATAISIVIYIAMLWVSLSLSIRRYHDHGKPGWWVLLAFVPIANIWYLIECGFLKGTTGPNAYGPDPLGGV